MTMIGERDVTSLMGGVPRPERQAVVVREVGPSESEVPVPEGWQLIPAGVLVKARANKAWLLSGDCKPWRLCWGGKEVWAEKFQTLGRVVSQAEGGPQALCGIAWVETSAGVLYKP